ncbi:hypothetical protein N7508_011070 [Penicillium antarcticum]|uniref:uncharacterized protein n=1 Tax=Penicillium antarcticum TaxID=416450 RepID=UPI0023831A05|nr:uncharacterized protein N7508_011070 [Penicillium antarcticum]KAJ5288295.1 hypothetical protein N7508_011070 [Penicillium antarcticum]
MPGFVIHDVIQRGETPPPVSSSLPNSPPNTVEKLRKCSTKVFKHIHNDTSLSPKIKDGLIRILEGGLTLAEVGAQFAADNVRILRRKKQAGTQKTKRRLSNLGPKLVKDCKKHIADRVDRERLQQFKRDKKSWRLAAIQKAIEDGDTEATGQNEAEIEAGMDEELGLEWIDGLFCIDTQGDPLFK